MDYKTTHVVAVADGLTGFNFYVDMQAAVQRSQQTGAHTDTLHQATALRFLRYLHKACTYGWQGGHSQGTLHMKVTQSVSSA